MAEWKKVIVSGSTANLAALQVDNLTSGQVVIGGGTSNLSTTAINGTGNVVATTGATGVTMTGSFSGSFDGSYTGSYTGSFTGSYTGSFTGTHTGSYTGSFTGSFSGSFQGTATSSSYALSASYAESASFANNANTASYAIYAVSASSAVNVSSIANNVTNNTNNYVLTATGGGSINGESNLQFDGTTLTVTGDEVITGNLTVQGTASFQNTSNLEVTDRFVLFASGSNTAGDGGIVVQQGIQNVGELFGYENSVNRWGFTSSFNASTPSFTSAAYITTTETSTSIPSAAPLYGGASNGYGNIHVKTDTGDIYIYA
jgi:hypothetical protein